MPDGNADETIIAEASFEDKYSAGVSKAAGETRKFKKELDNTKDSSEKANIAFLAQINALQGVQRGYSNVVSGVTTLGLLRPDEIAQLNKLKGVIDLVTGSLGLYKSVAKLVAATNINTLIPSLWGIAAATAGIGFAMLAATTASEDMRKLFSALTGISIGLAAAQFTLAAANSFAAISAAGPLAPVVAGVIAASVAGIATYLATAKTQAAVSPGELPQAQTEPGQSRTVLQTGQAVVHEGEEINRPARVSSPRYGGLGMTVIFQGVNDLTTYGGRRMMVEQLAAEMDQRTMMRGRTFRGA